MTAPGSTEVAVQRGTLRARVAVVAAGIRRRGRAVQSALDGIAIRGQLGPSVGRPHDRRPEPRF
jgi:hypothetical protein